MALTRPMWSKVRLTRWRTAVGVGHLQHLGDERIRVTIGEVGDLRGVSDGADHPVSAFEQLTGQFSAESEADAGNEPGPRCHGEVPFQFGSAGAVSSSARSALRVRG